MLPVAERLRVVRLHGSSPWERGESSGVSGCGRAVGSRGRASVSVKRWRAMGGGGRNEPGGVPGLGRQMAVAGTL